MTITAIVNPLIAPAMRVISSVTLSSPLSVTTTFDHGYQTGLIVRLDIPPGFGFTQANQQFGPIAVTSSTTFTMPIDATNFEPLSTPATYPLNAQYAQVIPIAEVNAILTQAVHNVLG